MIGAAGGRELLAALAFGAEHVTGVELNPVTISLVREHFADYTGHLTVRIAAAVAAIATLGICLGAFMPMGIRVVAGLSPHADVYVAWAWAVNGFFSVISSVLTTVRSMAWGFTLVLCLGFLIYSLAAAVLHSLPDGAETA